MLQTLILLVGRKKKKGEKKREIARPDFLQDRTCLAGYSTQDFCGCYMQLMADLRVSL
jgi:hypothetical protein